MVAQQAAHLVHLVVLVVAVVAVEPLAQHLLAVKVTQAVAVKVITATLVVLAAAEQEQLVLRL